jgi:DNA-binding NtrC family response regulator
MNDRLYRDARLAAAPSLPPLLHGTSPSMRALARAMHDLAHAEVNLLLQGEPGTGKLELAQSIHQQSRRAAQPFLTVRLGELTETLAREALFGAAGAGTRATVPPGGTLYIDSIDVLTVDLQRRLALALAGSGPWAAVRIISGTVSPLEEMVRVGRFRRDLFFRLGVVRVTIPPLRERSEDIAAIVAALIAAWSERDGISQSMLKRDVLAELGADVWPGNARELEQTLERVSSLARGGAVTLEHLRSVIGRRSRRNLAPDVFPLRQLERDYIAAVLASCNWNQSLAARRLGIGRNTLLRKIKAFHLGKAEAA